MRLAFLLCFTSVLIGIFPVFSRAQVDDETSDVDQIEAEIGKNASPRKVIVDDGTDDKNDTAAGLTHLDPFRDVSVIQKRYLPKTGRFQFFAGLTNLMNDPWFNGYGLNAKAGYHFNESWGLELSYLGLQTSESQSVKDLSSEHDVVTSSFISVKGYAGADIVWSPIYGKMAMGNRRIIPFDMYFALGGGTTSVNNGTGGSTVHIGTGQIFAVSKGMGFRWDFSWNSFSGKPTGLNSQTFNNLLLTAGVSFFLPEATGR